MATETLPHADAVQAVKNMDFETQHRTDLIQSMCQAVQALLLKPGPCNTLNAFRLLEEIENIADTLCCNVNAEAEKIGANYVGERADRISSQIYDGYRQYSKSAVGGADHG